jgi:uncharacterized C2H2 Zn-finger protein
LSLARYLNIEHESVIGREKTQHKALKKWKAKLML